MEKENYANWCCLLETNLIRAERDWRREWKGIQIEDNSKKVRNTRKFLKMQDKMWKKHNTKKYCKGDKNEDKLLRQKSKRKKVRYSTGKKKMKKVGKGKRKKGKRKKEKSK